MQDQQRRPSPLARTSKDFKPQLTKWPNQYPNSDQTNYRRNENRKNKNFSFPGNITKAYASKKSPSLGPTYCLLCICHVGYFIKFHIHIADDIDRRFFVCYGCFHVLQWQVCKSISNSLAMHGALKKCLQLPNREFLHASELWLQRPLQNIVRASRSSRRCKKTVRALSTNNICTPNTNKISQQ